MKKPPHQPLRHITKEQVQLVQKLAMELLNGAENAEQYLEMVCVFSELTSIGIEEIQNFKAQHGRLPDGKIQ